MKSEREENTIDYVTLSNEVKMPILGYGVYQVAQEKCERSVCYGFIDTVKRSREF